jgi:uncharacterized membrane protein (UPF0127 family)
MDKRWLLLLVFLLIPLSGCLDEGDNNRREDLEGKVGVEFMDMNGTKLLQLTCELADSAEEKAVGLMNRTDLDHLGGMVFYYEVPREVSFWMKNTLIPLDIVFISPEYRVIRVSQADPEPGVPDDQLTHYPSGGVVKYVVEMNQGLADDYDIVPDTGVTIWEY